MHAFFGAFVRDEWGVTSIEYALIAGGIALVIIAAVQAVGTSLSTIFTTVNGDFPAS
jgi:pilus assembly protein Flp/PilA